MIKNYVFMCALPCAGKSTYIETAYPDSATYAKYMQWCSAYARSNELDDFLSWCAKTPKKPVVIAADEIKEDMRGYSPSEAFKVHQASVDKAKEFVEGMAKSDVVYETVVLDGGGINNHYNSDINAFVRANCPDCRIKCIFFDTPIEVCLKRMEGRERKVPVDDVYKKNLKLVKCINKYIGEVDEFERVDYFTNKYLMLDMDGTLSCYGKPKLDIHGNSDFVSSELFKNLKPVKHVIDFVKEHYGDSMENVYVVTACANSIAWAEKNEWLDRYFPEIPKENRMFVGNKNWKHVFIEQFANKMKWEKKDVCIIDDFHDTLDKCLEAGINAIHPSNLSAMFDKYSYQG